MATSVNYDFTYQLGSDGDLKNSVKFESNSTAISTDVTFSNSGTDGFFLSSIEGDTSNILGVNGSNGGNAAQESYTTQPDNLIWFSEQADAQQSTLEGATADKDASKQGTAFDYVGQLRSFANVYAAVDTTGKLTSWFYDAPRLGTEAVIANNELISGTLLPGQDDPQSTSSITLPIPLGQSDGKGGIWYQILTYNEFLGDYWIKDGQSSNIKAAILATDINWLTTFASRTNGLLDSLGEINTFSLGYVQVGKSLCFLAGTKINTPSGEIPIESLEVGDLVITPEGPRAVRFVCQTTSSTADLETLPIRISAGALGNNVPCEDLYVSPGHAIFLEGSLVHASALINGTTICPVDSSHFAGSNSFIYYNIELEQHFLITANGCLAESYFDIIPRQDWDNFSEYMALYGSDEPLQELSYPVISCARQLPASLRLQLQLQEQGLTVTA